jgi:hypothetical protein
MHRHIITKSHKSSLLDVYKLMAKDESLKLVETAQKKVSLIAPTDLNNYFLEWSSLSQKLDPDSQICICKII